MPDANDINQAQAALQSAVQGAQKQIDATDALLKQRAGKDRSHIVWCVMGIYVFGVFTAITYAAWRGFTHHDAAAFTNITEIIKVAVLPVVTLVIGYYFGTQKGT